MTPFATLRLEVDLDETLPIGPGPDGQRGVAFIAGGRLEGERIAASVLGGEDWYVAMAFVYAWSYSVPLAMLVSVCALEFGRLLIDRDLKASLRMPWATAAGLLAGLVIHPYSPNSLKSIWMLIEITRSGVAGSKVELGTEFQRMSLSAAFTVSMPLMVSTRKDWFSAPLLNLSFKRARSTGVKSIERVT